MAEIPADRIIERRTNRQRLVDNLREAGAQLGRVTSEKQKDMLRDEIANLQAELRSLEGETGLSAYDFRPGDFVKKGESKHDFRPSDFGRAERADVPAGEPSRGAEEVPTVGTTPEGAVTGIVPARATIPPRQGASELERAGMRMGIEGAASFGLGSIGSRLGGPVGMRLGEGAGAFGGSLLSEFVDPTAHPLDTASMAGGLTLATGAASSAGANLMRRMLGKPGATGQFIRDIATRKGQVPPPGVVLESEFAQQAQSFGSAAFLLKDSIKQKLESISGLVGDDLRNWISGFQRYPELARKLFGEVDQALGSSGTRLMLDREVRDAAMPSINIFRRQGVPDNMPTGLQKLRNMAEGDTFASLTFKEAQDVATVLFARARALERAAVIDPTKTGGTNVAALVRDQAMKVRKGIDREIDEMIANKAIPNDVKTKLLGARENYAKWMEGEEVADLVLKASTDLATGHGKVGGKQLQAGLDAILREQEEKGITMISPVAAKNLQRYADALEAIEKSGQSTGFQFISRGMQLGGAASVIGGVVGLSGGVLGGTGLIAAPHVMSFLFSNDKAASMLIRGLKMEPGSAAAARLSRELLTLLAQENIVPLPREGLPGSPQSFNETPAGGVTGRGPAGGGADPFSSGG